LSLWKENVVVKKEKAVIKEVHYKVVVRGEEVPLKVLAPLKEEVAR
jgi:hypothetical protein